MKPKLKFFRIGDTLHVCDDTTEKAVLAKNVVPDGDAVAYPDGSSEWVVDEEVLNPAGEGSGRYVWDKSGNKTKHERVRYRKAPDGSVTRTVERVVYKEFHF